MQTFVHDFKYMKNEYINKNNFGISVLYKL